MHLHPQIPAGVRGQALIESVLLILLITAVSFATLQLCLLSADDMILNEAAFATARAAVVAPAEDVGAVTRKVSAYFLIDRAGRSEMPLSVSTEWNKDVYGKAGRDHSGSTIMAINTNLKYATRIMFASWINAGGASWRENCARARMIKSPDERYYDRAYPRAGRFQKQGKWDAI